MNPELQDQLVVIAILILAAIFRRDILIITRRLWHYWRAQEAAEKLDLYDRGRVEPLVEGFVEDCDSCDFCNTPLRVGVERKTYTCEHCGGYHFRTHAYCWRCLQIVRSFGDNDDDEDDNAENPDPDPKTPVRRWSPHPVFSN